MTDRYALADMEPLFAAELPAFMRQAMAGGGWDVEDTPELIASTLLGGLRLWLLEQPRRRRSDEVARAFEVVERLAHTDDPRLENALCVELLEGRWPRGHLRLMGPRTRELWEPAHQPPGEREGHYTLGSVDPVIAYGLPGFGHYVAEQGDWDPMDDDPKRVAPKLLRYLREWLLGLDGPGDRRQAAHAFELVEELAGSEDDGLREVLRVHLLAGPWPAGYLQLMGPSTLELRERAGGG
jgi:hypothetical protein